VVDVALGVEGCNGAGNSGIVGSYSYATCGGNVATFYSCTDEQCTNCPSSPTESLGCTGGEGVSVLLTCTPPSGTSTTGSSTLSSATSASGSTASSSTSGGVLVGGLSATYRYLDTDCSNTWFFASYTEVGNCSSNGGSCQSQNGVSSLAECLTSIPSQLSNTLRSAFYNSAQSCSGLASTVYDQVLGIQGCNLNSNGNYYEYIACSSGNTYTIFTCSDSKCSSCQGTSYTLGCSFNEQDGSGILTTCTPVSGSPSSSSSISSSVASSSSTHSSTSTSPSHTTGTTSSLTSSTSGQPISSGSANLVNFALFGGVVVIISFLL